MPAPCGHRSSVIEPREFSMDDSPILSRLTAGIEDAGVRLDVFLARSITALSRARIQNLIENCRVLLNNASAPKKTLLRPGDGIIVNLGAPQARESGPTPQNIALDILYEDEWLLAINKPAGMVVHPGHGVPDGTLVNALLYRVKTLSEGGERGRPGIVHRLDKDTSGVVLVAKSDAAHAKLAAMFAKREIHKLYVGICVGRRPDAAGAVQNPLGRSRRDPVKRAVRVDGKEAFTEYELAAHHCGVSVVRFLPRTGRTHQIRVHASSAGFPVLCDSLYGGGKDAAGRVSPLCRPFVSTVCRCFSRQALHARRISFVHPFLGSELAINAPLPPDFVLAIAAFEKAGERVDNI